VTTAARVVTSRRALLAGGAALIAAGCGPDGSSRVPPSGPALDAQLRAQEVVVQSYAGLRGREVRRMAAEARAGAARLRAAGARTGAAAGPAIRPSLRGALGAEETALATHVKGLGAGPLDLRPLKSELVLTSARHAAQLRARLGLDPAPAALPGAP
jgi:hypothetical protein